MSKKRLTKHVWFGSEAVANPETGKLEAKAPDVAINDGSKYWDLTGLTRGELYLNDNASDPALFCLASDGLVKRISGGSSTGGGTVDSKPSSLWTLNKQSEYLHLNEDGTITILENSLTVKGNVLATGNVVAYSAGAYDITNSMMMVLDPATLTVNEAGLITVIGGAGGGREYFAGNGMLLLNSNTFAAKFGVATGTVMEGNDPRVVKLNSGSWWGQSMSDTGIVDGVITINANGQSGTVGSLNSSYFHFNTTAPTFYFYKQLQVNGNIIPSANDGYDIGVNAVKWRNLYLSRNAIVEGSISNNDYFFSNLAARRGSGNETGTIKITCPFGFENNMNIYEIDIYEYVNGLGASKIIIGAYNYDNGTYYNHSYSITGSYNKGVRLCKDADGKVCILLGSTSTVWSYIKVYLRTILRGSSLNVADIKTGYSISLITDEAGLTSTITPILSNGQFRNVYARNRICVSGYDSTPDMVNYGAVVATQQSGTNQYCHYALVRSGVSTMGLGLNATNDLIFGIPTSDSLITLANTKVTFTRAGDGLFKGNVVAYSAGAYDITDSMKMVLDPATLAVNSAGLITVIGGAGGGGKEYLPGSGLVLLGGNTFVVNFGDSAGTVAEGGKYVKKVGDTMTGILNIDRTGAGGYVQFKRNNVVQGWVGDGSSNVTGIHLANVISGKTILLSNNGNLLYDNNTVWHAGNDGTGSGLDADTLNGVHAENFVVYNSVIDAESKSYKMLGYGYVAQGWHTSGPALAFGSTNGYTIQMQAQSGTSNIRVRFTIPTSFGAWRDLAFTDSNVATATKLQTARSLWGNNFDGTGNVDGIITVTNAGISSKFGSVNNSYCHLTTTAPAFYFDKQLTILGSVSPYTDAVYGLGNSSNRWGAVHLSDWVRSYGNVGWYSQTYEGGIYMNETDWVKIYNKPLYIDSAKAYGIGGHNVGLKLYSASHVGINFATSGYTWGIYGNNDGSLYFGRREGNVNNTSGNYLFQITGSGALVTGYFRSTSYIQSDSYIYIKNNITCLTRAYISGDGLTPDTSNYGAVVATQPVGSSYCHYALVKRGTATAGIGMDGSNNIIFGGAGTSGNISQLWATINRNGDVIATRDVSSGRDILATRNVIAYAAGVHDIADDIKMLIDNNTIVVDPVTGLIKTSLSAANFVTLNSEQTISGQKSFTNQYCKLPSHYYHNMYNEADVNGRVVYIHFYPQASYTNMSQVHFRVAKAGGGFRTFNIRGDGGASWEGTFTDSSDIRDKQIVSDFCDVLPIINDIPIFDYKSKKDINPYLESGTSAQALREVLPTFVFGKESDELGLSVAYARGAFCIAVKGLQEVKTYMSETDKRLLKVEEENKILRKVLTDNGMKIPAA